MTVNKGLKRAITILCIILFLVPSGSMITAEDNPNGTGLNTNATTANLPTESVGNSSDQSVVREVKEKRSKNSKHYQLADGSYKAVISMTDVHYEDETGELQDIKTDLIDEADIDLVDVPLSKESAREAKLIKNENKEKRKNNQIDKI